MYLFALTNLTNVMGLWKKIFIYFKIQSAGEMSLNFKMMSINNVSLAASIKLIMQKK